MNNLSLRKLFPFIFLLLLSAVSCNVHLFHKSPENKLFSRSVGNRKEVKVKEPRSVLRAKRKQEANERKLKKDYAKFVKRSQKRTLDIQTPEVQARMKQNKKDYTLRDKQKKKKVKAKTKRAERKYK
jgi:hypothetical protein